VGRTGSHTHTHAHTHTHWSHACTHLRRGQNGLVAPHGAAGRIKCALSSPSRREESFITQPPCTGNSMVGNSRDGRRLQAIAAWQRIWAAEHYATFPYSTICHTVHIPIRPCWWAVLIAYAPAQKSLLSSFATISHRSMKRSGVGAGAPGSKAPAGPRWNMSTPGTRMNG
jgi:hypothetical protein